MPAFDVARRWKGRVVLDRAGASSGRCSTSSIWSRTAGCGRRREADLYAYYGLAYTGASLVDLDEEDEEAAAPVRGLPPR